MIKRIVSTLLVLCFFASSPALAQTRTWIAHGTWNGYGTPNPINAGTGNYFGLYPYAIEAPNCFQIKSTTGAPWNPNSIGTDYYIEATNGATCAGGGSPNPGQGMYVNLPAPHRALGLVIPIKLNGNITTTTFFSRFNDCTHALTTGVAFGCIDYAALEIGTDNKIFSDITGSGSKSAALTLGSWSFLEWCQISGTNGSSTVPSKESAWLDATQFINNATPATTTPNIGGGSGITPVDYELGAGGTMDFGPWAVYDSGAACPSTGLSPTDLGKFYVADYQPTANGPTTNFTAAANANWQNAAAATPGSASYNADAVAAQVDIYQMTLGTHTNILFIGQRASVEKDAPGVRIGQLGWNISGTTYNCLFDNGFSLGADANNIAVALMVGTYQQIGCLSATDPSTSSAWSGAGNAGKITAKVLR
jgi:hypothetical protein